MTPCPSDDVLGAHVKRVLVGPDAEVVATHLDTCDSCRAIVLAAVRGGVRSEPELAVGTPSIPPTMPASPARHAFAIGQRIGRYQIRELLGAGGMGQVFSAYDAELDREIALKVMRPELVGGTGTLAERLVRESRMMAKLAHPSVITVYDVGRAGEAVFIAMELIRGETLGNYVRRVRPSWREIIAILERAGHGLAAANDAGIIHRDFKPDNVLVEIVGESIKRVVVTDFGVARTAHDHEPAGEDTRAPGQVELTKTGTTVGTPAYMAPEQLAGGDVDARADVFAFAVSAWELVFGERPFPGTTVQAIRTAMEAPPVPPPGHQLPARVVAALAGGLAVKPEGRHRDMHAFVRALAATRTRTKRSRALVAIAATTSAVVLVGAGLAGARALASEPASDPCARSLALFEISAPVDSVRAVLAGDPKRLAMIDGGLTRWRDTHAATCKPDTEPAQQPAIAACLDARRLELAGVVVDLQLDGAKALQLVDLIGDPAMCATPAPGLIAAHVPADPELRRRISALRYRAFAIERARDAGDYKRAIPEAAALANEAKPLWAPAHAELLYLLGTAEIQGGDTGKGVATLREAAAVAERAHHDYIAANVWIQIVQSTAFDLGDPARGIEYAAFAEAALERIGNQPDVAVMFHYTKGAALSQGNRNAEAEAEFQRALALAEQHAPQLIPVVIQGFGFVLEGHGRFDEAVVMYRRALAMLVKLEPRNLSNEITFRDRLASSLQMTGKNVEAEAESRQAVALSDKLLDEHNLDRAISHAGLAQVLEGAGKLDEALREAMYTLERVGAIAGERSSRYGDTLLLVGQILNDLQRHAEADQRLARACEILAFGVGEQNGRLAECWQHHAIALEGLGKHAAALELVERGFPILREVFGDDHPHIANAYLTRGGLYFELGQPAKAIPDLERAVALFEKIGTAMDPGHLASAEAALAEVLYGRDRKRARELMVKAVDHFAHASGNWEVTAREAKVWVAAHQ